MKLILPVTFLLAVFSFSVHADEIKFKFKNPSFSGSGTGAHYLTIENQEKSRRDKIKDDIEAALRQAEREDANSTINKFIRNLESRIYSQISKGLVDSMFCDPATTGLAIRPTKAKTPTNLLKNLFVFIIISINGFVL